MIPKLEVRHLLMLQAITETGSVTRAAERLAVTQSALTHRIREAERRLGVALFKRVGRRVFLTPAGERLQGTAVRVIDELQRAEDELRVPSGQAREVVRLGQGTYSRFHWLPELVNVLARTEPDLEIDLVARATHQPLVALQEGAADAVIVQGERRETGRFRWLRLQPDQLVAIMAPTHALAHKPYLVAEDFADERYITYSLTPEPGFEWQQVMRPANVRPRRLSLVQVPEAIIDLVRAGFGVSVLSSWFVEPEVEDGTLVAKPVTRDGITLNWWLAIRATEREGSPTRRLADAIIAWSGRAEGGLATLGFKSGKQE